MANLIETVTIPEGYMFRMRLKRPFRGSHNRTKTLILNELYQANKRGILVRNLKRQFEVKAPRTPFNSGPYSERPTIVKEYNTKVITIKDAQTRSPLQLIKALPLFSGLAIRCALCRMQHWHYIGSKDGRYHILRKGVRYLMAAQADGALERWIDENRRARQAKNNSKKSGKKT